MLASDDEKRAGADCREIPCAKAHPKMFNAWLTLGPEPHLLRPEVRARAFETCNLHCQGEAIDPEGNP